MGQVDRFTVSLDTELLAAFDHHIARRGYDNRSEAIRDLIRDLLTTSRVEGSKEPGAGVLSVVLDHRSGQEPQRLRALLAAESKWVRGWLHVPLDEHRDAVTIALAGPLHRIQAVADRIQAMRGTSLGHLSLFPSTE